MLLLIMFYTHNAVPFAAVASVAAVAACSLCIDYKIATLIYKILTFHKPCHT